MNDDATLDDLERHLRSSPILDVASFARHGAHRSWRLILGGGIGVLAKPADVMGDGEVVVRREVAAWVVARELGWWDMLGATVLRRIDSPADPGQEVEASLQILWPDAQPDGSRNAFSDEDVWRAAVFDLVICHEDRGGHNWLAVPQGSHSPRLKLVDHGYAFRHDLAEPNSTFFRAQKDHPLPQYCLAGLRRLKQPRQVEALNDLLASSALDSMWERVDHLLDTGTLGI